MGKVVSLDAFRASRDRDARERSDMDACAKRRGLKKCGAECELFGECEIHKRMVKEQVDGETTGR